MSLVLAVTNLRQFFESKKFNPIQAVPTG